MKCFALMLLVVPAVAVVNLRKTDACAAEDLKRRMQLQNKLAGDCDEMCKEVGAYPDKCSCPDFVEPDRTPGVMTWDELLAHMDNLVEWGGPRGLLKEWQSQASSVLQQKSIGGLDAKACAALDLKHRSQVQNKLASACIDMCKEIGAYPKCECPGFAPPDSTPGVMTWEELNAHMDNLVSWGMDMLKKAKTRAGSFMQNQTKAAASVSVKNQTSAKNVTHKGNPPYGGKWGEPLCYTANALSIFVSTDSGRSWTAVTKSGCTSSSTAYTNIAVCGKGTVTYFPSEQNCAGNSATMQGATNGPDVNEKDCYNDKAVGFYSLKFAC